MAYINPLLSKGLNWRILLVFLISVPLTLWAIIMSLFFGKSRLQHQKAIRKLLKLVLSKISISTYNDKALASGTPFIIAANHIDHFDWMALYSVLETDVCVVTDKFFSGFPFSLLTRNAGFFTLRQKASFGQSRDILRILNAVKERSSMLIFVNTAADNNDLLPNIRPGAAYLSIKSGAPVLPVRIKGSEGGNSLYIVFGKPLFPGTDDISKAGEFTNRIRDSILSL